MKHDSSNKSQAAAVEPVHHSEQLQLSANDSALPITTRQSRGWKSSTALIASTAPSGLFLALNPVLSCSRAKENMIDFYFQKKGIAGAQGVFFIIEVGKEEFGERNKRCFLDGRRSPFWQFGIFLMKDSSTFFSPVNESEIFLLRWFSDTLKVFFFIFFECKYSLGN